MSQLPDLADQLVCDEYGCDEAQTLSDHRPVSAELTIRAWKAADVPLAPTEAPTVRCRLKLHGLEHEHWAPTVAATPIDMEAGGSSRGAAGAAEQPAPVVTAAAVAGSTLHVAFPMPAEDPTYSLGRVQWLLGRASHSAYESVPYRDAHRDGVTLVAEIDVSATTAVHALVRLVDADGKGLGQGSIALPLPWLSPGGGEHRGETGTFEAILLHRGQSVGRLRGQATAAWAVSGVGSGAANAGGATMQPTVASLAEATYSARV